jgi:hypothetical protein
VTSYVVVAPVVVCKVEDDQHGYAYKHLQSGTPVPEGVDETWITGHLAIGMIAAIPEPAPPAAAPPLVPDPPPPSSPPPPEPEPPAAAEEKTGPGSSRGSSSGPGGSGKRG